MAFDERLANRVRRLFGTRRGIEEKRMFGGLAFMVRGHMSCGIVGSTLMVRVGPDDEKRFLAEPHVRPMDFTGRPLKGFLYVDAEGVASGPALRKWVDRAAAFADSKPRKVRTVSTLRESRKR